MSRKAQAKKTAAGRAARRRAAMYRARRRLSRVMSAAILAARRRVQGTGSLPTVRRGRPVVWAALSYLLIGTLVLWPSIRPGRTLVPADALNIVTPYSALPTAHEPHNLQLSDAAFQFFPWFAFMAEGMRHGEIRQWNPNLLAGVPVMPNGNVSPYYPPSWLGRSEERRVGKEGR